eukprot:TRINITY_DN2971_c0_g3_i3.p1 TRINITY_DN2971_c0_g3~~TRINITY_DN2971_c0_g3_i3.p1  ORF type:complete len:428 (-),score=50.30 TRINITY_DN2971_c0_g3_i3:273-1520(-)
MEEQSGLDGFLDSFSKDVPTNGEYLPVDTFMNDYLDQLQWTASGSLVQPMDSQNMDLQTQPNNQQIPPAVTREEQQRKINREAQQRFRQRNRARQSAMHQTYGELLNELKELQEISKETTQTQEKVNTLEERMKLLEAELEVVRKTAEDMKKTDEVSAESYSFEVRDEVRNMYVSLCNLRMYLRSKAIDRIGSTKDTTLDEKVSEKIQEMVGKSGQFCVTALRREGPIDIWAIVKAMATHHRDLFNGGTLPWTQKLPQEWIHIASNLQLSDKQIFDILVCRQEYVDRMEKLLTKRQEINYKIVGMLLPNAPVNLDTVSTKSGVIDLMKLPAGGASELDFYMKSLRQNLAEEQVYYSKLDEVAFNKIFSPLQVAWFMLESLPEHCDIVALQNAVYEVYGHKVKVNTDEDYCSLHNF